MFLVEMHLGYNAHGQRVPAAHIRACEDYAMAAFAAYFRGCQAFYGKGTWLNSLQLLEFESCSIIRAYTQSTDHFKDVWQVAEKVATALHQESVMVVILSLKGSLRLVKPRSVAAAPRLELLEKAS